MIILRVGTYGDYSILDLYENGRVPSAQGKHGKRGKWPNKFPGMENSFCQNIGKTKEFCFAQVVNFPLLKNTRYSHRTRLPRVQFYDIATFATTLVILHMKLSQISEIDTENFQVDRENTGNLQIGFGWGPSMVN